MHQMWYSCGGNYYFLHHLYKIDVKLKYVLLVKVFLGSEYLFADNFYGRSVPIYRFVVLLTSYSIFCRSFQQACFQPLSMNAASLEIVVHSVSISLLTYACGWPFVGVSFGRRWVWGRKWDNGGRRYDVIRAGGCNSSLSHKLQYYN